MNVSLALGPFFSWLKLGYVRKPNTPNKISCQNIRNIMKKRTVNKNLTSLYAGVGCYHINLSKPIQTYPIENFISNTSCAFTAQDIGCSETLKDMDTIIIRTFQIYLVRIAQSHRSITQILSTAYHLTAVWLIRRASKLCYRSLLTLISFGLLLPPAFDMTFG